MMIIDNVSLSSDSMKVIAMELIPFGYTEKSATYSYKLQPDDLK